MGSGWVGGWVGWYERNESLSLKGEEKWIWRRVNWCCLLMVMRSHYLERGSHFFYIVGTLRQPENPLVNFKWNLIYFNKHLMEFLWNSYGIYWWRCVSDHLECQPHFFSMDRPDEPGWVLALVFYTFWEHPNGDFCRNWWKKFPMQVSE